MSHNRRRSKRHSFEMVTPEQMIPADPSTNGHALASSAVDDYWVRALGKVGAQPIAPTPAYLQPPSNTAAPRFPEGQKPAGDLAASYWDRATGVASRRPSLPERPTAPAPAGGTVAPGAFQDAQVRVEDAAILSVGQLASRAGLVPMQSLPAGEPVTPISGAHARQKDPLASEVRGAHVRADDPLVGAAWETQLNEDDALTDQVRGAHVKADDPLATSSSPAHASGSNDAVEPSETESAEAAAEGVRARTRRRRFGIVPVAGAAAVLVSGFGGGAAYAYFTSHGSGTGHATTASPTGITATAVAAPGADANLYPGGPAAAVHFTVNNPNSRQVTFTGWSGAAISGVTPPSGSTCANSDFQVAAASGSFGSSLTIPANTAGGVSGTANGVVELKTTAQNGCQGATVTVSLTLTSGTL